MVYNRLIIFLSISLIIFPIFVQTTQSAFFYVYDPLEEDFQNSNENFSKINHAIENASSGDTIFLYNGIHIVNDSLLINKSINLVGENKNNTIILLKSNCDISRDCIIEVNKENVEISNIRIQPYDLSVDGLRIFNENVTIENMVVYNTVIGMYLKNATNCTFSNNSFINNYFAGIKSNINTGNNIISHNNFINNYRDGISFLYDYNSIIEYNNFSKNHQFGLYLSEGVNNKIRNNNFIDNNIGGLHLNSCSEITVMNNSIDNNSFYGITLLNSNDNSINLNIIKNHTIGINISFNSFNNNLINNYFYDNELNINILNENNNGGYLKNNIDFFPFYFLILSVIFWICFFCFYYKINSLIKLNKEKQIKDFKNDDKIKNQILIKSQIFNTILFSKKIHNDVDKYIIILLCRISWLSAMVSLIFGLILIFLL